MIAGIAIGVGVKDYFLPLFSHQYIISSRFQYATPAAPATININIQSIIISLSVQSEAESSQSFAGPSTSCSTLGGDLYTTAKKVQQPAHGGDAGLDVRGEY